MYRLTVGVMNDHMVNLLMGLISFTWSTRPLSTSLSGLRNSGVDAKQMKKETCSSLISNCKCAYMLWGDARVMHRKDF